MPSRTVPIFSSLLSIAFAPPAANKYKTSSEKKQTTSETFIPSPTLETVVATAALIDSRSLFSSVKNSLSNVDIRSLPKLLSPSSGRGVSDSRENAANSLPALYACDQAEAVGVETIFENAKFVSAIRRRITASRFRPRSHSDFNFSLDSPLKILRILNNYKIKRAVTKIRTPIIT